MSKFKEKLSLATDEVSQVQPLYREEIFKAVKDSPTLEVENKFATNGKLIQHPKVRMKKIMDTSNALPVVRDACISDVEVKGTDGLFKMEYLKIDKDLTGNSITSYIGFVTLLECKLDTDFNDKRLRAETILQVICYLKQQKDQGRDVPMVAIIGSKKNCFILKKDVVDTYIDENIINYTSASTAYTYNPQLILSLMQDNKITESCFIHTIDDNFKMKSLIESVYTYVSGNDNLRKMEPAVISRAFDIFSMQILKNASKIDGRLQAKYFLQLILNPDACYMHPKKKDTLIIDTDIVTVNTDAYLSFRAEFGTEKAYSLEEQRNFTAIADRLIEDADRRRRGDFYTPTIWVDEAHKLLTQQLGRNWRNEYMVWDCACGTKNLTRDYKFKDLYCSTLVDSDLTLSNKYNLNAIAFQYDFLNDDVEIFEELASRKAIKGHITMQDFIELNPKLLQEAPSLIQGLINGKPLLFFINPPYGTAKTNDKSGKSKDGAAKTAINNLMLQRKLNASASQELYSQFFFRILKLQELFDNIYLCMFSKGNIFSANSFLSFRDYSDSLMTFTRGIAFQASEFADCSGAWGVHLSLWQPHTVPNIDHICNFDICSIKDKFKVNILSSKRMYIITADKSTSSWLKVNDRTEDAPQMTSALSWRKEHNCGNLAPDAYGYFVNAGNNVQQSQQLVLLLSSCFNTGHGVSITEENFSQVCSVFTARRLITGAYATWFNDKDEYMIPDTSSPDYTQFEADSIVYSLFNNASNQSSLRNVDYNNKLWDIENQFFWMSNAEIRSLANGTYAPAIINNAVEQDTMDFPEDRFVYKKLKTVTLSPDAQELLNTASGLIRDSFKYRKLVAELHPEYHLNVWDMGYYQLNKLIKECGDLDLQNRFKAFRDMYKAFEDRLRPYVYELGFLKN